MMMSQADNAESQALKEENEKVKKIMQSLQEKLAQTLLGKSMLTEKSEGS